jgi:hypothetical protein
LETVPEAQPSIVLVKVDPPPSNVSSASMWTGVAAVAGRAAPTATMPTTSVAPRAYLLFTVDLPIAVRPSPVPSRFRR